MGIFERLANKLNIAVYRLLPDAFVFALILTIIVFLSSIVITEQSPMAVINHWENGFWKLLKFSMQMVLIVVTGHTLANAPIVKKGINNLATSARTPIQAIILVTVTSLTASYINWGFGLIVGALIAKKIAENVKDVKFPLLIASAYSGFIVWHAGLSGSIPLRVTNPEGLSKFTNGSLTEGISLSRTIFSIETITIVATLFIVVTIVNVWMHPKVEIKSIKKKAIAKKNIKEEKVEKKTIAEELENSFILSFLVSAMGLVFTASYFIENGFSLNLSILNFMFFFLGMLLHKTPIAFVNAMKEAVKTIYGIIIQYPLYAGIMGIMTGANVNGISLASLMSEFFVNISNADTFPLLTFLSAGIVNLFVPSGGGQWIVQGPVVLPAAIELGVDPAKAVMAIAWGDAWTNMLQPFWALPILAIAKLKIRDIMGYCIVVLGVSGVVIGSGLMLL